MFQQLYSCERFSTWSRLNGKAVRIREDNEALPAAGKWTDAKVKGGFLVD
jgi:hypothetical protein